MKDVILLLVLLISMPLLAAKVNDPTCRDLVRVKEEFLPKYFAAVDGYNRSGKEVDEVDVSGIVTESFIIKKECEKNKSSKLKDVRQFFKKIESTAPGFIVS